MYKRALNLNLIFIFILGTFLQGLAQLPLPGENNNPKPDQQNEPSQQLSQQQAAEICAQIDYVKRSIAEVNNRQAQNENELHQFEANLQRDNIEITRLEKEISNLQSQMDPVRQDNDIENQIESKKETIRNLRMKIEADKADLEAAKAVSRDLENQLSALQEQLQQLRQKGADCNEADASSDAVPLPLQPPAEDKVTLMGGPVKGYSGGIFTNQIIPLNGQGDTQKALKYVGQMLAKSGGSDSVLIQLDNYLKNYKPARGKTAYIFIGSTHEGNPYNPPYLKDGIIQFDAAPADNGTTKGTSVWLFKVPGNGDTRLLLNDRSRSTELSPATMITEAFKAGIKKTEHAGVFSISGSGEFYNDTIIRNGQQGISKKSILDNKSYITKIVAKKGTMFGFEYTYLGNLNRPYTFKVVHPAYISGPEKGKTEVAIQVKCSKGKQDNFIWQFTEDYELVPGEWLLQILDGGAKMYEKKFYITLDR